MLSTPNSTRLALAPLTGTGAGRPRRAQPARKGGNSSRSVSSSNSPTPRGGSRRRRRRMCRFFLAVRVGRQGVAEALPDVADAVQLAADGVLGQPLPAGPAQVLAQQRDRRVDAGVAGGVRPLPQSRLEQVA